MRLGLFLSTEEYAPTALLDQARLAADSGLSGLWISDHFHPWIDAQGQSPFVWSMIGALSQACDLPIMTAVTCPGRDMLAEAIDIIRRLWTGDVVNHRGAHYTVQSARIYTLPEVPPEIFISGLGPGSTAFAAEAGDGYVTTVPDGNLIGLFKEKAPGKPVTAGAKACFADSAEEAANIAYEKWPTTGVPGELNQVLPTPAHFEQAVQLVDRDMIANALPCGPDPGQHLEAVRSYQDAGVDELYVAPIGPHFREMIKLYAREIAPAVA